jgi:hypothetical protein
VYVVQTVQIIQKGVYHELAKDIKNDVSMIHFLTRFGEQEEIEYLARGHFNRLAATCPGGQI